MSLFLMLTCRKKVPSLKDVAVLLNISAVFDLKQVSLNGIFGQERWNVNTNNQFMVESTQFHRGNTSPV